MKKLLFILMLCPLMMITSCKDNANTSAGKNSKEILLDKEIEASNAMFPMQVDIATTLKSVSRDGKVVTYEYEIDESVLEFETLTAKEETYRSQLESQLAALSKPNAEMYAFVSILKETDCGLRYLYKGNLTGKTMAIEFTSDELKKLSEE